MKGKKLFLPLQKSCKESSPLKLNELGSISCPLAPLIHPAEDKITVIGSVTKVSSSENTLASELLSNTIGIKR